MNSIEVSENEISQPEHDCHDKGVPRGLPIRNSGLPKFSTLLSPETCERLRRSTLGGVRVFDESEF